jgi:RNA polymerase sigma-70 factor (ECF subfamily)
MATRDTVLGGPQKAFPSTIWSDVLGAADPASPERRRRLNELVRAYWKPVFAYIRSSWRKPVEDAKDLTQAFFAYVLEKRTLERLRPELGSFRGYLKLALKHFLIDAERSASARRPEKPLFRLEATAEQLDRLVPAAPGESPEEAYDRQWFRCLLEAAIRELKEKLAGGGKAVYFEVMRLYLIDPVLAPQSVSRSVSHAGETFEVPTYRDVAARLGIKETDVLNYLAFCRRELREILRARIRDYVATDGDVPAELQAFLKP